jgi:hypothetical protein
MSTDAGIERESASGCLCQLRTGLRHFERSVLQLDSVRAHTLPGGFSPNPGRIGGGYETATTNRDIALRPRGLVDRGYGLRS